MACTAFAGIARLILLTAANAPTGLLVDVACPRCAPKPPGAATPCLSAGAPPSAVKKPRGVHKVAELRPPPAVWAAADVFPVL